jgi:type 1 fimbria pilin
MKKITIMGLALLLFVSMAAIVSCKKEDDSNSTLQIRLTDAPTALDEVNVDIREVRVKFSDDSLSNNGWVTMATNAKIYNLLGLQNGVDTVLATGIFPKDVVKEIRFILGPNNSVKDAGVVYPLTIPSGSESGLKIKVKKSLNATLETLVIDFDAALSVKKESNGDYKLRPVLKVK